MFTRNDTKIVKICPTPDYFVGALPIREQLWNTIKKLGLGKIIDEGSFYIKHKKMKEFHDVCMELGLEIRFVPYDEITDKPYIQKQSKIMHTFRL